MEERIREIKAIIQEYGIEHIGFIKFDDLEVKKPYLVSPEKIGFKPKSIIIMLAPYKSEDLPANVNISLYATSEDYHFFFESLFDEVCHTLKRKYPAYSFIGFSDHSPIDERNAAAKAGLGIIGDNGLIINKKYGSYVFIGEIITDMEAYASPFEVKGCHHCGLCKKNCPSPDECLSAITQKKGDLSDKDKLLIISNNTVWGCDACQKACPMNEDISFSEIKFFKQNKIYTLKEDDILSMSDADFAKRAYSWRGRETILRNIKLFEGE